MKKREDKYIINLSHEFKTPVSNLDLLLETLYDYDLNIPVGQKREILELGLKETKRLKDLVTQFLYFKEELDLDFHNKERTIFPFPNIESNLSYKLLFFIRIPLLVSNLIVLVILVILAFIKNYIFILS